MRLAAVRMHSLLRQMVLVFLTTKEQLIRHLYTNLDRRLLLTSNTYHYDCYQQNDYEHRQCAQDDLMIVTAPKP